MSKVIIVSYTDGEYDTYFKLYSYSPAIVEMLKENLKEYLQKQGFYLSTIKDWKKCLASENWEGDTPVFVTDDQNHEVEITWENIDKNAIAGLYGIVFLIPGCRVMHFCKVNETILIVFETNDFEIRILTSILSA